MSVSSIFRIQDVSGGASTVRRGFSGSAMHISEAWVQTTEMTQDSGAHMIWLGDDHHIALGTAGTSYLSGDGTTVTLVGQLAVGAGGPTIRSGAGVPAAIHPVGSLYLRTGGGVGTTLYVSQGGGTWNAVAGV